VLLDENKIPAESDILRFQKDLRENVQHNNNEMKLKKVYPKIMIMMQVYLNNA